MWVRPHGHPEPGQHLLGFVLPQMPINLGRSNLTVNPSPGIELVIMVGDGLRLTSMVVMVVMGTVPMPVVMGTVPMPITGVCLMVMSLEMTVNIDPSVEVAVRRTDHRIGDVLLRITKEDRENILSCPSLWEPSNWKAAQGRQHSS